MSETSGARGGDPASLAQAAQEMEAVAAYLDSQEVTPRLSRRIVLFAAALPAAERILKETTGAPVRPFSTRWD
jgi:hypothetical protein